MALFRVQSQSTRMLTTRIGRAGSAQITRGDVMRGYQRFATAVIASVFLFGGIMPSSVSAQAPAAGQADPPKPVFTLTGDAAVITMLIKPDKTNDFELVLHRLKEALEKSDNSKRRQ